MAPAGTGTPVVDNEPVSMAPESGNGGRFPAALLDWGAERLNSSRRSCVTYVFPGGSAPVFKTTDRISYIILFAEARRGVPPHNPVRRSDASPDAALPHDMRSAMLK